MANSTQKIVLPDIPEFYEKKFQFQPAVAIRSMPIVNSHQTLTENGAPAYDTTNSAILDAFNNLSDSTFGSDVAGYLGKSWAEDPELTLRLIWTLRSIPDGKGLKDIFYQAFGWLYKNHPRTAISNLHLLVEPVCLPANKNKSAKAHGSWKDLLNILCLATLNQLTDIDGPPVFLYAPLMEFTYSKKGEKTGTPAARIEKSQIEGQERKVAAREARTNKLTHRPFIRRPVDIKVLHEIQSLEPDADRITLMKQISLAGKWAPTPGASHDRVTNIATAISQFIHASQVITPYPSALNTPISLHERSAILRSFYQRWVLTELRRISAYPEPLMASNRWTEINYSFVPSICMNQNITHFFNHDPEGFEKYIVKVETGKKTISGATLLPHELVAQIVALNNAPVRRGRKNLTISAIPAVVEARKALAQNKGRVIEAQWKTLIESLREAGSLDNCLAICDVSGSMGNIGGVYDKKSVDPIFPSVALSLVLATLAKPPFNAGFITFSAEPQFVRVDLKQSLFEQVNSMAYASWGINTDFRSVFIDLLLPLAVKNKVKQEDMVKRLFVFSDMQFDAALPEESSKSWETTYDFIERAYMEAGYEVPQIVFWDLNASGEPKTVEVESNRKGVAMMNGFSPALLKVFMGESEWEEVSEDKTVDDELFNPINVMKKALLRKSFDGLVVVD